MSFQSLDVNEVVEHVAIGVTTEQLVALLHEWFERGDWYWYGDLVRFECPAVDSDLPYCTAAQAALVEGGFAVIKVLSSFDGTSYRTVRLNRRRIRDGLRIFAQKYPSRLLSVLSHESDLTTVSRFAQCVVYGQATAP